LFDNNKRNEPTPFLTPAVVGEEKRKGGRGEEGEKGGRRRRRRRWRRSRRSRRSRRRRRRKKRRRKRKKRSLAGRCFGGSARYAEASPESFLPKVSFSAPQSAREVEGDCRGVNREGWRGQRGIEGGSGAQRGRSRRDS